MFKLLRPLVVLAIGTVIAACAGQTAAGGSGAASPAAVAEASAGPSAPPDLPTPAPTITAAPPASPFPLAAGWWDNAVCYEVFVRSFYDSNGDGTGDFNGLTEKLDYINDGDAATSSDLGANCIWLMPVAEAESYHGYDVVDFRAVEQDYGSTEDFKRMLDEAHQRGIKVIVDLVLNHTSSQHPWFQEALSDPQSPKRDWYLWSADDPGYSNPWGEDPWHPSPTATEFYYGIFYEGMPDLNYRNPEVTAEAEDITRFWLEELGVDGFRLDAIKHLIENGQVQENTPETHAWLRNYRSLLQEVKPDVFTVGEIFGATPLTLEEYFPDQLDTYFLFDAGEAALAAANLGSGQQYVGTVAAATQSVPFQRWAPFLTNHDQNRAMSTLGDDVAKAKLAATALLTLPGLPFVYYGEELGMLGEKPDELIRTPMQWSGEANGGFSSGQPWQALQADAAEKNVAAQDADPDSLLNHYRRLIALATTEPALGTGSLSALESEQAAVGAFLRRSGDNTVLVVINFGTEPLDGVALSAGASDLPPATYTSAALLGEQAAAELTVADGGTIDGFVPLPTLAPRTGYIWRLTQK